MKIGKIAVIALTAIVFLSGCKFSEVPAENGISVTYPQTDEDHPELNDKSIEDFLEVASQDGMSLYVCPFNGDFYVVSPDGTKWYSNPPDRENETVAAGKYMSEIGSTLIIQYFNPAMGENSNINTQADSVYDGLFDIKAIPNGFCTEYQFNFIKTEEGKEEPSRYTIKIPLYIYLSEGTFKAEVGVGQILNTHPDMFLYNISLLPYFGAGSKDDEGYLFVPDGSGGLIDFNTGRNFAAGYSRQVFGEDPLIAKKSYDLTVEQQEVRLPVFGIKKGVSAVLALIEDNPEMSTVNAWTNNQVTSYANIYSSFDIYGKMDYDIGSISAPIMEKGETAVKKIGVRYSFLAREEANYSGMARTYKKHLTEKYKLTPKQYQPALFVELFAGVNKTVSRFGIQSDTVVPLTTTAQVKEIADKLKDAGVEKTVFLYRNWNKNILSGKITGSASASGKIKKGSLSVSDLSSEDGFTLYPLFDNFFSFSKADIVQTTSYTANDLSGITVRLKQHSPGLGIADGKPVYFLTLEKIGSFAERLSKSIESQKIKKAAFSDLGQMLYNDYRDKSGKRIHIREEAQKSLEELTKTAQTMLYYPNEYAIQYASDIFALPDQSSGHDIISRDVPFYQMAVSGLVRYASQPKGNSNKGKNSFLKSVETGSCPAFTWIYEPASSLKTTQLGALSGCHYGQSFELAVDEYKKMSEIFKLTEGSLLIGHDKESEGVFVSKYENGTLVYVNYNSDEYTAKDGTVVSGGGYAVKEGTD